MKTTGNIGTTISSHSLLVWIKLDSLDNRNGGAMVL